MKKQEINWAEYYANGGEMPQEFEQGLFDKDGVRKIDAKTIRRLSEYVNALPQTKLLHTDADGNYTDERLALHHAIIDRQKEGLVCIQKKQPIAILMGGSPASGKSSFLNKYAPYLLKNEILRIDADEIRAQLPEYKGYNASQTQLETKDIVNVLLSDRTIGIPCNYDIIYDGTMNTTKSYIPLIKLLRSIGYKIYIVYIDRVPKQIVRQRALGRYQRRGRFVPMEVIDDFFSKGKAALEELKDKADGYMIIDGSLPDYPVIEKGGMPLPRHREYSKIGTPIQMDAPSFEAGGDVRKVTMTEEAAKKTPAGGVIVGERHGQTIVHSDGSQGGYLVGKLHSENGIKAINKSTGKYLEMQGAEVIITAPAVADQTKTEFDGKLMTNREILSAINVRGGGVSFAEGGEIPTEIYFTGDSYKFGGKLSSDHDIAYQISQCGCSHKKAADSDQIDDVKDVAVDGIAGNDLFAKGGFISTSLGDYKNPYQLNRAIEAFLDSVDTSRVLTVDEINFIGMYSGYGGLEKQGSFSDDELKGLLYEYYTPDEIVKKMWALAYKFGFGTFAEPMVLEPSVGTGNFFRYAPDGAHLFGNEINRYSKQICELLYPRANITLQLFEKNFILKNNSVRAKFHHLTKYHLVIGNPPYGRAASKYMSMGEADYTKASSFTEYFISRGLDLLHSGGLLIFVVGAEQYNGGTLFLDAPSSEVKKEIYKKASLMDAYRLPTKLFERTGVASEIIVFKKR